MNISLFALSLTFKKGFQSWNIHLSHHWLPCILSFFRGYLPHLPTYLTCLACLPTWTTYLPDHPMWPTYLNYLPTYLPQLPTYLPTSTTCNLPTYTHLPDQPTYLPIWPTYLPTYLPTHRVRKSKNFPDSKIFTAKTFRITCVNHNIGDFATNARKT